MRTWQGILSCIEKVVVETYGPHTKEIGSAVLGLQDTKWYANVGTPSPLDGQVIRVRSWQEAWAILSDSDRYSSRGILLSPAELVRAARRTSPAQQAWWEEARQLLVQEVDIDYPPASPEPIPGRPTADLELREALAMDYIGDTLEHVLEEIIVSDRVACTCFREQLQWLAAGYFPCGWDGRWPNGRMRVF
jgi:hypothetical protein